MRSAFQNLLESCCKQFNWKLIAEWPITRADDPQYGVRLIGQVISVSLARPLPDLGLAES